MDEEGCPEECPVCGCDLRASTSGKRKEHVDRCLLEVDLQVDQELRKKQEKEKKEAEKSVTCVLCDVSLDGMPEEERHKHVNACLEGQEEFLEEKTRKSQEMCALFRQGDSPSNACTYCGVPLDGKSLRARVSHIKRCTNKVKRLAKELMQRDMDIEQWLSTLGLQKYTQAFLSRGIQLNMLDQLTEADLRSMGVTTLGPRRKILASIAEMGAAARELNTNKVGTSQDGEETAFPEPSFRPIEIDHGDTSDDSDCQIVAVNDHASRLGPCQLQERHCNAGQHVRGCADKQYDAMEEEEEVVQCTPQFRASIVAKNFPRQTGTSLWEFSCQNNLDGDLWGEKENVSGR